MTLQFFGDLQCPTSRAFTLELLPSLISRWVRMGRLRVEYRALRTATPNAEAFMAQQAAALAAGMQRKLWNFIEYFYHEQGRENSGYATEGFLLSLAEQTPGLDVKQWNKDRRETSLAAEVATDEQAAARQGLHETPSLLVGPTPVGQEGKPHGSPWSIRSRSNRQSKGCSGKDRDARARRQATTPRPPARWRSPIGPRAHRRQAVRASPCRPDAAHRGWALMQLVRRALATLIAPLLDAPPIGLCP